MLSYPICIISVFNHICSMYNLSNTFMSARHMLMEQYLFRLWFKNYKLVAIQYLLMHCKYILKSTILNKMLLYKRYIFTVHIRTIE